MKSGYHAVYARNFCQGIDDARKYGFDFAQFELGVPTFFLDGLTPEDLREIRGYADSQGVEITFHAPGDNVGLLVDCPCVRKGTLEQFKLNLDRANALRARHMTVHAGVCSAFRKSGGEADDRTEYYEQILYENLLAVLGWAGDVLVCLENYQFTPLITRVAQRLIDEGRGLCLTLDVAKPHERAFYEKNRRVIREMHIHDVNETGSHQTVGTGKLDFRAFKEFCGPEVWLNYEVRPVGEAAKSKQALEELWGL